MFYDTGEKDVLGYKAYNRLSCKIALYVDGGALEPINRDNPR